MVLAGCWEPLTFADVLSKFKEQADCSDKTSSELLTYDVECRYFWVFPEAVAANFVSGFHLLPTDPASVEG